MIEKFILELPTLLQNSVTEKWRQLVIILDEKNYILPTDTVFLSQLTRCLACSEFISQIILKTPELLLELHKKKELYRPFVTSDFFTLLKELTLKNSEIDFLQLLRLFRRNIMLRIAWRDLTGLATLQETMTELSIFADVVIKHCIEYLELTLQPEFGEPIDELGNISNFFVLALGKLGSFELNFSSDIDLIFCYSNTKPEFEKFFYKLSQQLIHLLSKITADGFVFRVDMRLRPHGSSGALVYSKKAMVSYYQSQGREWERFALSKARLINPSTSGTELMRTIQQFVYRRYVDFSIIDALREMKNLMRREGHALENNIKRGEGGIRELEFIVQVFQLIRGGKEPWLQNSAIFNMLPKLAEFQCLPNEVVHELIQAYIFLRTTEHHLQEINDQQTQTLPVSDIEKIQLAYSLGFTNWENFIELLQQHREKVAIHFNQMIAVPNKQQSISINLDPTFTALIEGNLTEAAAATALLQLGIKVPQPFIKQLEKLRHSFNYHAMNENTKPKLILVLQQLLPLVAESNNSEIVFSSVVSLLEQIIRRSIYIVLLLENPLAIVQLIELFSMSPWISEQLIKFPFLLEELIDTKALSTEKLQDQLRQKMLSIPFDDLEAQMDCLRQFKQMQTLRVAASDATGALPLMKVSDHLSNTASVIVGYSERIAWNTLVEKYGHPTNNEEQLHADDFLIIAYGKLGGLELGYGSDLDLVFLHPDTSHNAMTDGENSITNSQFYLRLAQRIIHILNTNTAMGKLYEIDTRLRPSGSAGLLVTSLESYASYQETMAWTWEHQALIRARAITGSYDLMSKFSLIRLITLTKLRNYSVLKNEVVLMRQKMLDQVESHNENLFDVSQDAGGIKDIEFMVQFLALRYADQYPEVIAYTDNIRILDAFLEFGILAETEVSMLSGLYCKYREVTHRAALKNELPLVDKKLWRDQINEITSLWNRIFAI